MFQKVEVYSSPRNLWVPTRALLDRASFGQNGSLVSEYFLRDLQAGHDSSQGTLRGTAGRGVSLGAIDLKFQATENGILESGLTFVETFRVAPRVQNFDILLGRSFLRDIEGGSTHFTYQGASSRSGAFCITCCSTTEY